jgi:hypothetical protein
MLLLGRLFGSIVDPHHVDADPDSTYHLDADPDSDFYLMRFQSRLFSPWCGCGPDPKKGSNPWKCAKIGSYSIHDAYPDPVPNPADYFDADADPDFYLMRMRIQVTKMMRIRIHNTTFLKSMVLLMLRFAHFTHLIRDQIFIIFWLDSEVPQNSISMQNIWYGSGFAGGRELQFI